MVAAKNGNVISDATLESSKIEKHRNAKGMSWPTTAVFIVGDMMGGGMVALPIALVNTGLVPGIVFILLGGMFTLYTGIQLGDNWTLMQKNWPEYKRHCRRPYPEMAYRAMGTKARHFVSLCLCLTQFGITTVLTLLASTNISNLIMATFGIHIHFCYIIVLVGLSVWAFVMLNSPMDFWQAGIASAVSSTIAAILVLIGTAHDAPVCGPVATYPEFSFKSLCLGYGTIVFSYGGHGAFPTIQHDMEKPYRFNRSVWASYIFLVAFYLAIGIFGHAVYGDSMTNTVIPSLQTTWLSQVVNLMITAHVLPTIVIVFSPLSQQVEEWTNVPKQKFSLRRFVVRSILLWGSMFTALSVPRFGVFLDLVGGSTMTLMTMLLPSVFYLFLFAAEKKRIDTSRQIQNSSNPQDNQLAGLSDVIKYTSKPVLLFNVISLIFGVTGGIAASTSAITELLDTSLAPPCYVQWFKSGLAAVLHDSGAVHCCGHFMNTTVSGVDPSGFCQVRQRHF